MNSLSQLFSELLLMSRDGALLAIGVWLFILLFKSILSTRIQHILWLLVGIRLMLPVLPESGISWKTLIPVSTNPVVQFNTGEQPENYDFAANQPAAEPKLESTNPANEPGPAPTLINKWSLLQVGAITWLSGLLIVLAVFIVGNLRYGYRRLPITRCQKTEAILRKIASEWKTQCPRLIIHQAIPSPAITGVFRPKILLPENLVSELNTDQLEYIIRHEMAHHKRGDVIVSWVFCILRAVHWFNPIVWIAFRKIRVAAEHATDEYVLRNTPNANNQNYGKVLIQLLQNRSFRDCRPQPGLVGILESRSELTTRFKNISQFNHKRSWVVPAFSLITLFGFISIGLTDPETKEEVKPPQTAEEKPEKKPEVTNNWKIIKIGDRQYVSAKNVSQFYKMKSLEIIDDEYRFKHPKIYMVWKIGSKMIYVNRIKFDLSYPIVKSEGKALISTVDLAKLVDPVIRPSYIKQSISFDTVVIDPGHGGIDPGAENSLDMEKNYNLDLAQHLETELKKQGFKTVMTRTDDSYINQEDRSKIANSQENAIFISIHHNSSSNRSVSGFETMTCQFKATKTANGADRLKSSALDSTNIALATAVHAGLIQRFKPNDRGIKRQELKVLSEIKHPGIFLEVGFLSNPTEAKKIDDPDHRQRVAETIAKSITRFKTAIAKKSR